MKASELIVRLCDLIKQSGGDMEVLVDCVDPFELVPIEEVDVPPEHDVLVIWPRVAAEAKQCVFFQGFQDCLATRRVTSTNRCRCLLRRLGLTGGGRIG